MLIVAAVGNDGPAAPPAYPACYRGVLAVTGVDARTAPCLRRAARSMSISRRQATACSPRRVWPAPTGCAAPPSLRRSSQGASRSAIPCPRSIRSIRQSPVSSSRPAIRASRGATKSTGTA
ncbi:hypothetical protein [Sphingopyxis bauzanensis]